ncbi:hypothetical protein C8J98_102345 [Luteibacter sp. OK325]|uniref:hypothetical protein n=1 Tax=Luteibacter sp. OK325 TaxID=2135670 RepID=UPI000D4DAA67|nr:hypothetical protein [Luteibacter sp. OK325]PTR34157.1 hypothetical protein C8J98_102345 [Luteibacter sp. OK325]
MDAKTAWPDRVTIDGTAFKARVDSGDGLVSLPCASEPQVSVGDVITQTVGRRENSLEVLEVDFQPNGSLGIGTVHRHLLVLTVEPTTSQAHTQQPGATAAVGNVVPRKAALPRKAAPVPAAQAAPPSPLKLAELVERVSRSADAEAKAMLIALLDNASVSTIVGPVTALGMRALLRS